MWAKIPLVRFPTKIDVKNYIHRLFYGQLHALAAIEYITIMCVLYYYHIMSGTQQKKCTMWLPTSTDTRTFSRGARTLRSSRSDPDSV